MAPTEAIDFYVSHLLSPRAEQDPNNPPLLSVFALIINRAHALAAGSAAPPANNLVARDSSSSAPGTGNLNHFKRQQQVLVIPTTYANLNDSPSPGSVVGITLGAVLGFLLIFFIVLAIIRQVYGGNREEVVEEEIIRRHRGSRSVKRSPTASSMSEIPAPAPPVVETSRRESRRESRRTSRQTRRSQPREPETVVVEEEMSVDEPPEVVVEEEEDDIVEVIEEHSPEPPPRRKKRSGHYRTVDPGAFGGGDAPNRRMSRQS